MSVTNKTPRKRKTLEKPIRIFSIAPGHWKKAQITQKGIHRRYMPLNTVNSDAAELVSLAENTNKPELAKIILGASQKKITPAVTATLKNRSILGMKKIKRKKN